MTDRDTIARLIERLKQERDFAQRTYHECQRLLHELEAALASRLDLLFPDGSRIVGEDAQTTAALASRLEPAAPPQQHVEDALHEVFTRHGLASRSDFAGTVYRPAELITDLIHWAAAMCRQSREPAAPPAPETEHVCACGTVMVCPDIRCDLHKGPSPDNAPRRAKWRFFDDGDFGSYWYCACCGAKKPESSS